jgi:hypothetical protein
MTNEMESSAQRSPSDWHTSLKAFEADRRTKYQSNVETLDLYWKSHCELIEASVHETARAYRLVLGISKAHERMAVTLGKTVQSSQSQSSVTSSVSATASATASATVSLSEQQLDSLEEDTAAMIQNFGESALTMETNVASSLHSLLQRIQATQSQVSKEGSKMLKVLEKAEAQVEQAWGKLVTYIITSAQNKQPYRAMSWHDCGIFMQCIIERVYTYSTYRRCLSHGCYSFCADTCFEAAAVSLSLPASTDFPGSPVGTESTSTSVDGSVSSQSPQKSKSTGSDAWLAEFQYRNCLSCFEQAWDEKSAEFSRLFSAVKEAECMRRINLREIMILLVRQQQNPFLDVEDTQAVALTDWVENETSRENVQENVQASIRQRMEALGASSTDSGGTMDLYRRQFTPVSPLESDYLVAAFVVEQRQRPGDSKIMLAVVTAESFLHLFDLASDRIQLSSTPEEAFQVLLPMNDPPALGKTLESSAAVWNGRLKPWRTVELEHCSVALVREDTVVEIFETGSTAGSVNRIRLGVSSPRERTAFATAIHGNAAGANP